MEKDSAVIQNTNYKLLDLMKFICAFLVIGIHTRPFQVVSDVADKLFYYDISNYAVPFFYACTGYFLIIRQQNKGVHEKICFRIKKVLRLYVIWSIIYLPLTFCGWIIEGNREPVYLLRSVRNFILVGDNFYSWALWYLNGLVFALIFIDLLLRKFSIKQIVKFGSVMYVLGIILTMFEGHLNKLPMIVSAAVKLYFVAFVTTRNGLFQSLIFVSIGMLVAEIEKLGKLRISTGSIIAVALMYLTKIATSLIGGGQYFSKILDLPTFFFLFAVVISACKKIDLNGKFYVRLRNWSETIYFVHMYFVALCALILYKSDYHNFKTFFITASGSLMISWITSLYKERKNR